MYSPTRYKILQLKEEKYTNQKNHSKQEKQPYRGTSTESTTKATQ